MVVIGVLAGPSLVDCFNSEGNMGQCLRGKMADAGILSRPATAVATPEQTALAESPAATPAPEPAATEPQPEAAPPAAETPAVPDDLVGATFGLLRAEPDGSVVIAGSGTPGSEVEVFADGELLGKTIVEPSGDWVLVPDAPIPPGGTEITLGESGKDGQAAEAFVVVINPDKSSEPLVVASTPGAASQVLQGLTPPAGQTTTVAAAEPPPALAPPAAPALEPAPASEPAPTSEPAPESAPEAPATVAQPASEPASVPEPAPAAPAAEAPVSPPPAPETSVAAADPAPTTPPPVAAPADSAPPTIDAIEIEGNRTFFAGGGPEGATMRLYVDDAFIADAIVSDGRWLVEAGNVLTKPSQRIRIDMLQPGSAEVAARAEVDFVVDLPEAEPPVAVAQAEPAAAPEPPAEPAPAPAPAAEAAQPAPASSQPAPAAGREPAPNAPAEPAPVPAEPAASPAATTTVPSAEPQPATSDEAEIPTMVATAVGDPEAARFASGKAIIRTGDNLWTIARRVYGAGIKYTTIYEANNGQIRDPDRIYPGQVFDLPSAAD